MTPPEPKNTTHLTWEIDNDTFLKLPSWPRRETGSQYRIVPQPAEQAEQPISSKTDGGSQGPDSCEQADQRHWRIILTPLGITGKPLPLEIRGDVVIGAHPEANGKLDVNIAQWRGGEQGVSRRHIMLRPSRNKLFVMDLKSTNGTHINGLPLGVGWAYALKDGDLMTLGRLHVRVRLTQGPTAETD